VNWRLVMRPRARADIRAAGRWYEKRRSGLGSQFLIEIEKATQSLLEGPQRHPECYLDYRRVLTGRFPYKIFYRIEGEEIIVHSVLHAKQDHRRRLK